MKNILKFQEIFWQNVFFHRAATELARAAEAHRVPAAVSSLPFCLLARVDGLLGLFLGNSKKKNTKQQLLL